MVRYVNENLLIENKTISEIKLFHSYSDEKVKNKVIRIFNIWDQRGVYNEEFLTDLHNLISVNPINQRQQQAESDDEQQASIISEHIRVCVRHERDTDRSFKVLSKAPLCDTENIHSLKGTHNGIVTLVWIYSNWFFHLQIENMWRM